MRRAEIVAGITSGLLAASATAGALLGFGIRAGAPARPFNTIGALLLASRAQTTAGLSAATVAGIVVHVMVMLLCGLVYAALVQRAAGHRVLPALLVAVAVLAVELFLARAFGAGPAAMLSSWSLTATSVVLAAALPLGMRFAFSSVYKN